MPPEVVLIVVLGSICGALFHLVFRGRRLGQLLARLMVGIGAFAVGHLVGRSADPGLPTIGPLHAIEGFAVSSAALFIARLLKL